MRRIAPSCLVALLFAAPLPARASQTDLTVVNLNVLHGIFCPPDNCRLADRIDLLFQWIEAAGCPDVVTLQEVNEAGPNPRQLIDNALASACSGQYQSLYTPVQGADEEMLLSRYPVLESQTQVLHHQGVFSRHVLHARIGHPAGPVDIFTTHLASSSDNADSACAAPCPAECVSAGATTNRACQAVQTADFVESRHETLAPAILAGDFNAGPGSFEYQHLTTTRGYTDTYLAAGNPECVPATGVGCTSGRTSDDLSEIESTAANVDERIDYAFLVPPPAGSTCNGAIEAAGDPDSDGTTTRIFADVANPFAACGPAPAAVCWPSDHEGNELDLELGGVCKQQVPSASLPALLLLALALAWGGRQVRVRVARP
jgi:endonuclease/exonuclease/phosphatase family metal-dependent hydrolase